MKTTEEMIEVMQGWENGKEIQQKYLYGSDMVHSWTAQAVMSDGKPIWNWASIDYRIKPEPKEIWVNEYKPETHRYSYVVFDDRQEAENAAGAAIRTAVKYREVIEEISTTWREESEDSG